MKYLDLIAYPVALAVVYVPIAVVRWQSDPAGWLEVDRLVWVLWAMCWGFALQRRIIRGGAPLWTVNP